MVIGTNSIKSFPAQINIKLFTSQGLNNFKKISSSTTLFYHTNICLDHTIYPFKKFFFVNMHHIKLSCFQSISLFQHLPENIHTLFLTLIPLTFLTTLAFSKNITIVTYNTLVYNQNQVLCLWKEGSM